MKASSSVFGKVGSIISTKLAERNFDIEKFPQEVQDVIVEAQKLADNTRTNVHHIHVFAVILDKPDFSAILKKQKFDVVEINKGVRQCMLEMAVKKDVDSPATLSPSLLASFVEMQDQAPSVDKLLQSCLKDAAVKSTMEKLNIPSDVFQEVREGASMFINWTEMAQNGNLGPVINREKEVQRLVQILGKREKRHCVIIGNKGVGKKALVHAIALKSVDSKQKSFHNTLVISCEAFKFVEECKTQEDVAKNVSKMVKSVSKRNIVLHLNNADRLFGAKGLNNISIDLLQLLCSNPRISVIATCSQDNWKRLFETDPLICREFSSISVEEFTDKQAVEVLRVVADRYQRFHNIRIGENEIQTAVKLAKRYLKDRALPESAIDLIDEASANQKMELDDLPSHVVAAMTKSVGLRAQLRALSKENDCRLINKLEGKLKDNETTVKNYLNSSSEKEENERNLTEENLGKVLETWTGISVAKSLASDLEKFNDTANILAKRVVGQDGAIAALAKSVRRNAAGLRDAGKPIGSFLFLGASGTGKTELAKALAEFLFDDERAMLRFDMSEFMERHMAQRLIGSPPGYQGADEGGQLTEAIKKKPYSVLLFDEIEKAHSDVFNLLLQVLDDGRLTDGKGKTVDFTNTVVIMTSNIGAKKILEAPEEMFDTDDGRQEMKKMIQAEMKEFLRPEFINRIDEIAVFNSLRENVLLSILDIQIKRIEKLLADKEISISITGEAKKELISRDYEPAFGARPLKRAVVKYIQDPISELILAGKLNKNIVQVSLDKHNNIVVE